MLLLRILNPEPQELDHKFLKRFVGLKVSQEADTEVEGDIMKLELFEWCIGGKERFQHGLRVDSICVDLNHAQVRRVNELLEQSHKFVTAKLHLSEVYFLDHLKLFVG